MDAAKISAGAIGAGAHAGAMSVGMATPFGGLMGGDALNAQMSSSVACWRCGTMNAAGAHFCGNCGASVGMTNGWGGAFGKPMPGSSGWDLAMSYPQ